MERKFIYHFKHIQNPASENNLCKHIWRSHWSWTCFPLLLEACLWCSRCYVGTIQYAQKVTTFL